MYYKKLLLALLFAISLTLQLIHAQDYDDLADPQGRRFRRKKKPQQSYGGPCGRFFGITYVNLNYEYNCGGGHYPGASPYIGNGLFGGGGGHKPHKPHHGGGHHQQGGGGYFGGGGGGGHHQHQHQHGGGLFGGSGGGILGGNVEENRPAHLQNIANFVQNTPSAFSNFNPGGLGGNNGGLFGFGLFDGSIIQSFVSLFTPSNPTNNNNNNNYIITTPSPPPPAIVSGGGGTIVDEKPVHEDHDEVSETLYQNKIRRRRNDVSGNYFGGFGYRDIRRFNRQVLRPIYGLFRRRRR